MADRRRAPTLSLPGKGWWFLGVTATVVGTGLVAAYLYWETLGSPYESTSGTLRNVAVVFGGVIALAMAWWRGLVASDHERITRRALANDQYEHSVEMLHRDGVYPAVRLSAIFTLNDLAYHYPGDYAPKVLDLFNNLIENSPASWVDERESAELLVTMMQNLVDRLEKVGPSEA